MNSVLLDLLQRQQRDGFPDLGGSEVVATIPVSERLVNEAGATLMPPGSKVREIETGLRRACAYRHQRCFPPFR